MDQGFSCLRRTDPGLAASSFAGSENQLLIVDGIQIMRLSLIARLNWEVSRLSRAMPIASTPLICTSDVTDSSSRCLWLRESRLSTRFASRRALITAFVFPWIAPCVVGLHHTRQHRRDYAHERLRFGFLVSHCLPVELTTSRGYAHRVPCQGCNNAKRRERVRKSLPEAGLPC